MTVLRFIGYLLAPLFAPVIIVALVIGYMLLYAVLDIGQTWLKAKRDPRYDPYWWMTE